MQTFTNNTGISLPLAVWLVGDGYDFKPGAKQISVTSLIKPVRQTVLKSRLNGAHAVTPDVADFIASRLGHSIHDAIEKSWTKDSADALRKLGYPDSIVKRVRINPKAQGGLKLSETVTEDGEEIIPIWIEERSTRHIGGYTISGKFDMILEGVLQDFKSTSVFSFIKGSKDEDYSLQGSMYRWLNPSRVTEDYMNIHFIFTDWASYMAKRDASYPQQRVLTHRVELKSMAETEAFISDKIRQLDLYWDQPESALPLCTDKELWKSAPSYKYYLDPNKTEGRSTKNFDSAADAADFKASKGGKGVVIEIPGKVKACSYCPAFDICTQKDAYDHD